MSKLISLKSAKDLKAAVYNPRTISKSQMDGLTQSLGAFGEIGGVVLNQRTKTLIAGHQRTKALAKWPSKIITKEAKDEFGTVATGYILYKTDKGTLRVPLRVVDWDLKKEKQANIAANMHGGDFDKQKLATLVAELETAKNFSIELLGMDTHDLTMLKSVLKDAPEDEEGEGEEGEFESVLDRTDKLKKSSEKVCCPRCKLSFVPKSKAKKKL